MVIVDMVDADLSTQGRVIRVFVSSTFRDMAAEREELVKRVFPQLRKLCETRGVTWGEVDLRWGVSDEQKAEGQVLPICLAEIHRCRPYFIGMLGERYGWIPEQLPALVLAQEPWLGGYEGRSVTELEILCGVLDDPEMERHAFFYLRDPRFLQNLPSDQRAAFEEGSYESVQKLLALKERIRRSPFPVRENYSDVREFGQLVLSDFTQLIDRLFPEGSAPDGLGREAASHESFAIARSHVFIGRQRDLEQLDAHVRSDGPPLVVVGESGLGKSALLANWALRLRATNPDLFVFTHFIGASSESTDWAALARRLIGALNRRYGLTVEMPNNATGLRGAFAAALRMASVMHRVVIVIDGLDQLDDQDQAPDLVWLPSDLLSKVRLVLSTLPGRALDEIERRHWPKLELPALTPSEREQLIVDYLAQYTKTLPRSQVGRIAAAPAVGNPLFLTALLEELRVWGEHETLEARIQDYLSSGSIDQLFQKILGRYEVDYGRDSPGLVGKAFSLIWAGRRGLAEAELLELLGHDGEPLPRAIWSPLFLAAERSLISHLGRIGFFHDYFRRAVRDRYLADASAQAEIHQRLADYFAPRELTQRKIDELPWQLVQAGAWAALTVLLTQLPFVRAAWGEAGYEIRGYWRLIDRRDPDAVLHAYQPVFEQPNEHLDYVYLVSLILMWLDHPKESLRLQSALMDLLDRIDSDHPGSIANLRQSFVGICCEAAYNYLGLGDFDAALEMAKSAKGLGKDDPRLLAGAVGVEATIFAKQGRSAEASAGFEQAAHYLRSLGDEAELAQIINNQASLLVEADPPRALQLLSDQERILRGLGDYYTLGACLGNQGAALKKMGRSDDAMKRFSEQERICRDIGFMQGLRSALMQEGDIQRLSGKLDQALAHFQEGESIARRLDDPMSLANFLSFQSVVKQESGRLIEAIQLLKKAEASFTEAEAIEQAIAAKFQQAELYAAHVRMPAAAIPAMRQALKSAEDHGFQDLARAMRGAIDRIAQRQAGDT
jgi:tetratricopeptide (TPR) repeat protein